jgi:beta-N-acetylhexosaminidase
MSLSRALSLFLAAARPALVVAALPFALDWRAPLFASVRPWVLAALIALPVVVIVAEVWALRRRAEPLWILRPLSAVSLGLAALCLASVLKLEARFHWMRYEVLHADADQLERLGRHIVIGYRSRAELTRLIERRAVAGVFLTARNVRGHDADTIRRELAALQDIRRQQGLPPLLIATDQEGGMVSRLSPPLTRLPPLPEVVAREPDEAKRRKAVEDYAATQGRELAGLGVNVNFAPVVDLPHGPVNPDDRLSRIHDRAISSDPYIVAAVAETYCAQLAANGVRCTLKHFPGLGRVFEDTHLQAANLPTPVSELAAADWVPFRALMQRSDPIVMLGHARLTALDSHRPASFSRAVVHDLIRTGWNHDGVLITDDFSMGAVYYSAEGIGGGSVEALNNGVDLILVSYDMDQFYVVMHALIRAERAGVLQGEALQRSGRRLASLSKVLVDGGAGDLGAEDLRALIETPASPGAGRFGLICATMLVNAEVLAHAPPPRY